MTDPSEPVRWGILGTAGIARSAFLPALVQTGGGTALVVGSRDGARAERWAREHGVAEGVEGYARVLEDPRVEAVYVPLPNGLHAEWATAALQAGKAVFCEKPLCVTPEETEALLRAAHATTGPLWEAFVFPFHPQTDRLRELIATGSVGELREVRSSLHFLLDDEEDIRMLLELAGGSVQDVGCYPIRLARLLFETEPELERTVADAHWAGSGVDEECWGALRFPDDRRLLLSCGFRASDDSSTTLLGTHGRIHVTNPFHAGPGDTITVVRDEHVETEPAPGAEERSFTAAIRHVHRAIRGLEAPRHVAVDEAMGNAEAIAAVLRTAGGLRPLDPRKSTAAMAHFRGAYAATPPWDIGRPQPALLALAEADKLRGRVLDAGCGTGEHALMAAAFGLDATGIDAASPAIEIAKAKALSRGLDVRFLIGDILELATLEERFDTVLDSGLFHSFDDDERNRYVESLRAVISPGGHCFILCFSDRQPGVLGPRRVTQDEIRAAFADGWRVDSIEPAVLETNVEGRDVQAWLASITRV